MNLLKIKPNDTLFFRNGMPFDAGQNMWIGTHLMPYPSVFYGAIFSAILGQNPTKRVDLLKESNLEEVLELGRVYIYDEENGDLYMPAPLDLFENDRGRVCFGEIRDGFLYSPGESFKRVDRKYIKVSAFQSYRLNMDYCLSAYGDDVFFCNSYKVGIKKNENRGNVEDDHLYRIDLAEFKGQKWSYVVEYTINRSNIGISHKGTLKLGGEGKSCKYNVVETDSIPYELRLLNDYVDTEDCLYDKVKMILTSPGIYKNQGWKPEFHKEDIKLICAITGKPLYIGGFDIKNNRPKPMYRSVPAGSIYILESKAFKSTKLCCIKNMIKNNIKDSEDDFRGFNSFEIVPYGGEV